MYEKTLKVETRYEGLVVDVEVQEVELETGQLAQREIVRHQPAVAVVVRHDDGRFLFIRQFRKPAEQVMIEAVAGVCEEGEDPTVCAARELREETGFAARSIRHLGLIFPSPGYVDERIDIFFAEVSGKPGALTLDHDERVETLGVTAAEFQELIRHNKIHDGKTLAAWLMFTTTAMEPTP